MSQPSTTTILPEAQASRPLPEPRPAWLATILQRDRVWLLVIILIIAALFLGGCHERSSCGHVSSCGSSSGSDSAVAVFYVAYILVWIIASAAGG